MKHTVWEKNNFSHVNIVAASYTYCLFVCHTSVYLISKLCSYYIDIGMAHHITLDHSQLKLPEVAPQDAQINYVYHNSVQGKENEKFLYL